MYSKEFKQNLLKQFIGVSSYTVKEFSQLIGVPSPTIEYWIAGRSVINDTKFAFILGTMKKKGYYKPPHIIISSKKKKSNELFKKIRRSCSLSRNDLANVFKERKKSIDSQQIGRYERGKTKIPEDILVLLVKIAKEYNVKVK